MNIYQKIVLIGGLVLLLGVISLYTPYNHINYKGNKGELVVGTSYGSIFAPPNAADGIPFQTGKYTHTKNEQGEQVTIAQRYMTTDANTVAIDYLKLITFILTIALVTGVLFIVFKNLNRRIE